MYYRRKILLSLMQVFGQEISRLKLQKLLFLLNTEVDKKFYEFVPYKFGGFSFQANADLKTLVKYNIVVETEHGWLKNNTIDYIFQLTKHDKELIEQIQNDFFHLDEKNLIHYTYTKYPYYAIKSTVASKYLGGEGLAAIKKEVPKSDVEALFTIGYEGKSLEYYLNQLIKADIKILVDVRRNPLSMKYGFSKSQLKNACEGVGISYMHFPEVGIQSEKRKVLNNQTDYDNLFEAYKLETLRITSEIQHKIYQLVDKNKRIALTCFEANICQCHRKHLAENITKAHNLKLIHL